MQRSAPVIAAVILIPVAAVAALPLMRYLQSDQETLVMNDTARQNAPGSFVKLPDGVTHYQLGGPATGVPLLLVPGFSTPYNVWDPTFEGLTGAGLHVLRYELFGRGYSDRPDARYDADFYDRQIADLLNALGIAQVDIAGISMGGPLALTFANRHPEKVRRVVLIDPGYWTAISLPYGLRLPVLGTYNMGSEWRRDWRNRSGPISRTQVNTRIISTRTSTRCAISASAGRSCRRCGTT